ncbi:UPF0676 protein C1494.01 [Drosophila simulans]|uniref:GD18451 n=1 Tax=Drosophila simulans TaxID=7240 RepID=B4R0L7_DROSI|nr:UPF0676 protein C1494.01 [Drosophila simulans]EDX13940.1 GD18451 [Drosophila simulans]KMZ05127.1 uncharacterized protein Dsimw501_GD18451 [Drosophila simulans]
MINSKIREDKLETLVSRSAVPIIDLAHCGKSLVHRVGQQLHKAFTEKGIAFLVNHGIAEDKIKAVWDQFDNFLDLPAEVQDRHRRKDGVNYGYVSPGMERFDGSTPELRHAYNICKLDEQNIPREALPEFAEDITTLCTDLKAMSLYIMKAMEVALEIPPSFFIDKHSQMLEGDSLNMSTLRMLYYPAIVDDEPGQSEGAIRCGAHVDYGTFTLLAQDSEGGLEVQLPGSEKWERVGHLPGAILINGGELLSIWTKQRYHALPHRVVIPEQELIRTRGRHSIAYFCHPNNSILISPNDLLAEGEAKSEDKVYSAYELIQKKFNDTYGQRSQ